MEETIQQSEKKKFSFIGLYDKQYKKLLVISLGILLLAFIQIGYQLATTGDFMNKGVSLKGGLTITVEKSADTASLQSYLIETFPGADISVRSISRAGAASGLIIEASDVESAPFIKAIEEKLEITKEQYSVEVMGSSLGQSFFRETFKAVIIAFLFMGVVVFIYFSAEFWPRVLSFIIGITAGLLIYYGNNLFFFIPALLLIAALFYIFFRYSVPSVAVILCAFCDIIETLAVINFLEIKISTAGIAAFLMLIGYSVDTDILLTTRVLKRKEETIFASTVSAAKTGLMMTVTAIIAVVIALVFAQADVLKEIMIIVLIGLVLDIINTWIQNAAILRWYIERKQKNVQA